MGRDGPRRRKPAHGARELPPDQRRQDPGRRVGYHACTDLDLVEGAEVGEQVVQIVGVARAALGSEALELELEPGNYFRVEQLA